MFATLSNVFFVKKDQIQEGPLEEAIEEAVASIDEGGEKETTDTGGGGQVEENVDADSTLKPEPAESEVKQDDNDTGGTPVVEESHSAEESSVE